MGTILRSNPIDILESVRARLVEVMDWPEERVRFGDPDDLESYPQADQFLTVWYGGDRPETNISLAGGRVDDRHYFQVEVTLFTRCGLDEPGSGYWWLTEAELGHLVWVNALHNALNVFLPVDKDGNGLCAEPLKHAGGTRPKRDQRDRDWGKSTSTWVAHFLTDVAQGYQ